MEKDDAEYGDELPTAAVRESTTPGASAGRLSLHVIGDQIFAMHPLPGRGRVIIGRSQRVDLRIDDPSISRTHAALYLGATVEIEDLGSANGTFVRGRPLQSGERVEVVPGETIDLGSVMVSVQAGVSRRPRRLWNHDYFEARLEDETARAERLHEQFAVLRLGVGATLSVAEVQDVFAKLLSAEHMAATYAPNEYELLLPQTHPDAARALAEQVVAAFAERGVKARKGLAFYPRDSRDPETLLATACRLVRGAPDEAQSGPIAIGDVVVLDDAMQGLHRMATRIAGGSISVLLLGETGVGKEIFAETVHRRSPRAPKPFLKLNCAALSETLLESELFGHEKGAFSGAVASKSGLLETADGGTVFLDEVGEMPLNIQAKLLRVLEERKVMRVGGLKARPIDVRFIAATNRDLEIEIERGRFRKDLFYRLNGISLLIPPLRDRPSEVAALARLFLQRAASEMERPAPRLSNEALELLQRYPWPGNIRELRNVIERAILLCPDELITLEHLPVEKIEATLAACAPRIGAEPTITGVVDGGLLGSLPPQVAFINGGGGFPGGGGGFAGNGSTTGFPGNGGGGFAGNGSTTGFPVGGQGYPGGGRATPSYGLPAYPPNVTSLPSFAGAPAGNLSDAELQERQRIIEALERCAGNQTHAARLLGISRGTLVARLDHYSLPRPRKPR